MNNWLNNLPDGCTDEDIEAYFSGRPMSEEDAKDCIREELSDEGFDEDEIDDMVDDEFKQNWYFVNYSQRNGGSGYVHR